MKQITLSVLILLSLLVAAQSKAGRWPRTKVPCDGVSGGSPGYFWDEQKCEICYDQNCYCNKFYECSSCTEKHSLFVSKQPNPARKCYPCSDNDQEATKCCINQEVQQGSGWTYGYHSTQCQDKSILFGHTCVDIASDYNCKQMTSYGRCKQCLTGYYLSEDSTCQACGSTCADCQSKDTCRQCKSQYFFLTLQNALTDTEKTDAKKYPYICQKCSDYCICEGKMQSGLRKDCEECIKGYYLIDNSCKACNKTCVTCKTENFCLECKNDESQSYFLENGVCYACPENCRVCTYSKDLADTTCSNDGCENGYYRNLDITNRYTCEECQQSEYHGRCDKIGDDIIPTYCNYDNKIDPIPTQRASIDDLLFLSKDHKGQSACFENKYKCKKIVTQVTEAQEESYQFCTECYDNYVLDNFQCKSCMDSVEGCSACKVMDKCLTCSAGYAINSDSKCNKCLENCVACKENKNSLKEPLCTECKVGYYSKTTTTCAACTKSKCASCPNDKCELCMPGYGLASEECKICTLRNCATCKFQDDKETCSKCNDGYYLQNNECFDMSLTRCLKFDTLNTVCQECKHGYRLVAGRCLLAYWYKNIYAASYFNMKVNCNPSSNYRSDGFWL